MINDFLEISKQIIKCPSKAQCMRECKSIDKCPPQPGFIGRNYKGIVIIGANPGTGSNREYYQKMNKIYYSLAEKFANSGKIEDYHKYLDFTADYMKAWNQHLCNQKFRNLLNYDIEDIAYLNIVKCRTSETSSNVFHNCGNDLTLRCAKGYLLQQLEILKPECIVGHWKSIEGTLRKLGYDLSSVNYASYSGQRNLPVEKRIKSINNIFRRN